MMGRNLLAWPSAVETKPANYLRICLPNCRSHFADDHSPTENIRLRSSLQINNSLPIYYEPNSSRNLQPGIPVALELTITHLWNIFPLHVKMQQREADRSMRRFTAWADSGDKTTSKLYSLTFAACSFLSQPRGTCSYFLNFCTSFLLQIHFGFAAQYTKTCRVDKPHYNILEYISYL